MPQTPPIKNDLALLFTVLVWGLNFPVLKATLAVMPPHAMNVFRLSVSALVLGALYFARQRKTSLPFFAPLRYYFWPLFVMGLLGYLLYQYFFIVGVDLTTAGSAALIMSSSPVWTAVFGHLFRFDKLHRMAWVGLLTTFTGAIIIVLGGTKAIDFTNQTFLGNTIMVLAALCWGAYTAFNKPLTSKLSPVTITFFGLFFALPFLYALGIPEFNHVVWDEVNGWIWIAIVFSGGLSTGIVVVLWNTAVKRVGPSHTAVFGNLVPVVALLSSAFFLDEMITLVQIAGGVFILGGLFIMRRTRTRDTAGATVL